MPVFTSVAGERRFRDAYAAVLARWPADREERRLSTGFGTTVVQVCGPPSGRPVLLLHGAGATAASWFAVARTLGRSCRVYAPDRPGEPGLSESGPAAVRSREDWMAWLATVLDRLAVDRCAVVGHSYGGWLALGLALHAPHRVSRLALLDPTSCFKGGRLGYNARAVPLLLRGTAARMRAFLAWETGGRLADEQVLALLGSATEDVRGVRVVFPTRPADEALRGFDGRVLLALPSEGRQNDPDRTAAAARSLLRDVRVLRLEGETHHTLPMSVPDDLAAALRGLLSPVG